MEKFYLTTPIYYVNDVPHIGHAYTTILADVIKRYKQLRGYQVLFLTGTDEHGQKIERSAAKQGLTPKQLADSMVEHFKELWQTLNIDYDIFIRTTDEVHIKGVQKIFARVMEKGDIYLGEYAGHYCISCENFIPDSAEESADGKRTCPDCGRPTDNRVKEKCYFFRLSAYGDKLLKFYEENPDFVTPRSRMNEVVSFVKMGLRDLSVTRSTVKWGVPVPGDPQQTIYVWFDALSNYITAIDYLNEGERFAAFWPADLHIMAKDILKYHAVYWPAFLMAAGLPLPKKELIHGWWLKDEKKMSKSSGNVLDPHILLKHFSADAIRYFLMREASIGADGNFSHEGFISRVNTDLTNDWANLVSRTTGMIEKYFANSFQDAARLHGKGEGDPRPLCRTGKNGPGQLRPVPVQPRPGEHFRIRQQPEPLHRRSPALEPGQGRGERAAPGRGPEDPGPGHPERQHPAVAHPARYGRQGARHLQRPGPGPRLERPARGLRHQPGRAAVPARGQQGLFQ